MDLIPCEICNDFINISNYSLHISHHQNYINFESLIRYELTPNIRRGRTRISNGILTNFLRDNLLNENIDDYEYNLNLCDAIGKVEKGISNIELISDLIVSKEKNLLKDNKCPICIEMLIEKKKLRKLKCSHIFCHNCIKKWLNTSKKCPICNINLEDSFIEQIDSSPG